MDTHDVLKTITTITGLMVALSPCLQIRRMFVTGTSDDVSIGYFLLLIVGLCMWVIYGLSNDDVVLWTCNAVGAAVAITTVGVAIRLRRLAARATGEGPARPAS